MKFVDIIVRLGEAKPVRSVNLWARIVQSNPILFSFLVNNVGNEQKTMCPNSSVVIEIFLTNLTRNPFSEAEFFKYLSNYGTAIPE